MRTLAITQNITLDGSIEMLGDWFDPQGQAGVDNSDLLDQLHREDEQSDGLLVGRRTFEDLRGYWPHQSDDSTGITKSLNRQRKYVVTSTMTDPESQNCTILSGDAVQDVRGVKEQPRERHRSHWLVDEYRLFVYPVVQGRGRRLFPDGFECPKLRLDETKAFRSGIAYLRYARS